MEGNGFVLQKWRFNLHDLFDWSFPVFYGV